MLIQLTNERLNKEDEDFVKLFKQRAREFKESLDKQKPSGVDTSTLKFTKLQQILFDYNEKDIYPDFSEDFVDIDLKTEPIAIPSKDATPTAPRSPLFRPTLQVETSESVSSRFSVNGNITPPQKRKLRWVDQC